MLVQCLFKVSKVIINKALSLRPFLLHLVPPIVQSDGSSSLIAVINQSVTISFVVLNASPPVNEIQWSFVSSNEQYSLNNVDPEQYVFSPDSLSLTISIVEFSNEGNYSVTVSNPAGYSSATVNIDVQGIF